MSPDNKASYNVLDLRHEDAIHPLFQLRYIGVLDGNAVTRQFDDDTHTAQIDNNGSGNTTFRLILTDDTTGVTNVDGDVSTTLQAVVDAINAVDGWEARRFNAAADYPMNTNDFIDVASFSVPRTFTNLVNRDASEVTITQARLASPEVGRLGQIEIARIFGGATFTGAATFTISRDQGDAASEEEVLLTPTVPATTTEAALEDFVTSPLKFKGPLLIELSAATTLTAGSTSIRILWRHADESAG